METKLMLEGEKQSGEEEAALFYNALAEKVVAHGQACQRIIDEETHEPFSRPLPPVVFSLEDTVAQLQYFAETYCIQAFSDRDAFNFVLKPLDFLNVGSRQIPVNIGSLRVEIREVKTEYSEEVYKDKEYITHAHCDWKVTVHQWDTRRGYTHPHVQSGFLCMGDGAIAYAMCLQQNLLLTALDMMVSVLSCARSSHAYYGVRFFQRTIWATCDSCSIKGELKVFSSCRRCRQLLCQSCVKRSLKGQCYCETCLLYIGWSKEKIEKHKAQEAQEKIARQQQYLEQLKIKVPGSAIVMQPPVMTVQYALP